MGMSAVPLRRILDVEHVTCAELEAFAETVRQAVCETFVRLDNDWIAVGHMSGGYRWGHADVTCPALPHDQTPPLHASTGTTSSTSSQLLPACLPAQGPRSPLSSSSATCSRWQTSGTPQRCSTPAAQYWSSRAATASRATRRSRHGSAAPGASWRRWGSTCRAPPGKGSWGWGRCACGRAACACRGRWGTWTRGRRWCRCRTYGRCVGRRAQWGGTGMCGMYGSRTRWPGGEGKWRELERGMGWERESGPGLGGGGQV